MNQMEHTAKCPSCAAGHLKRAHRLTVDAPLQMSLGKRRYYCAECGWTGWKRRLHRQQRGTRRLRKESGTAKDTLTALLITFVLLVVSWIAYRIYATW